MRTAAAILLCLLLSPASPALSDEFAILRYQRAGGAIVVNTGGDFVDPYFALKALLTAQDEGLDIRGPALAWIHWLLPRQLPDGRFRRYCRERSGKWRGCKEADADDALFALWLQLLYRLAPASGLPPEWRASVNKAGYQLARLYDHKLGIYAVSRKNPVGLFIDNVEIWAAFKDISASQRRLGELEAAQPTQARAETMASSITHVFWDKKRGAFRVSTQRQPEHDFFPDAVAQIYPWLAGLPIPQDRNLAWPEWKRRYGEVWIERQSDPHPWGLVALAALELGDEDTAACWMARSAPLRYGREWNVLEDAAYQAIAARLAKIKLSPQCELAGAGNRTKS